MRSLFTLSLCFLLSVTVHAIHIERLTVEQNLSNNETLNITQDINGAMWFLSEEGINTFSGGRFVIPENLKTIVCDSLNNEVHFIESSSVHPYLYMANYKYGVSCYNVETDQLVETPIITYLQRNKISSISFILNKGSYLWFVAPRNGLYRYNQLTHEITVYDKKTIPEFEQMELTVIGVRKHMVYIGTWSMGFLTLDTRTSKLMHYTNQSTEGALPDNAIRAVEVMQNGSVWVGSARGLSLFTKDEDNPFVYYSSSKDPRKVPDKMVYDITQLKDGSLLVGVELHGVYKLTPDKMFSNGPQLSFEKMENDFSSLSFSEFSVREIFQDSFRNVWVSTYGGGIGFISHEPPAFECLSRIADGTNPASLSHAVAWGICVDNQDRLWVGTDGEGVDVFRQGRRIANLNQKSDDGIGMSVLCATKDKEGILWFGTYQHGLFRVDPNKMKLEPVKYKGRKINDVRDVTVDGNNNLFVASIDGLYKFDLRANSAVHYTADNNVLYSNHIRSAYVDSRGLLWVGHFSDGIKVFDMKMMKEVVVPVANNLKGVHIRNIIEDSRQQIWVATDRGLVRINMDNNEANKRVYTEKDGLINNNIQAIIEFPEGIIWGSTTRGLIRIDLKDESLSCYTETNSKKLHSFRKNSVAHDGLHLYFGSSEGLWSFNPFKTNQSLKAPKPVIASCHQLGETTSDFFVGQKEYTHPASLTRRLSGLEIKFLLRDYAYHNRLTYQYKLEGRDHAWYDLRRDQHLILRNILPGKYTLKIKSILDGDMHNMSIAMLHLNITPPFWTTWWFILIAIFAFALFVWIGFRYYVKQLELRQMFELEKQAHAHENELNLERLRYFTDITHEIRTPLTLIMGPLCDLLSSADVSAIIKKEIHVIYRSAQRLLNLTNMLIMFRKLENNKLVVRPKRGDFSTFCAAQIADFRVLNRNKKVQVSFKAQEGMEPVYFDCEIMTIVLTNLLSNALKHTREGIVLLDITQNVNTDQTIVRVQDSGEGISQKKLGHIFQRWYSTDESSSTFSNGIGLSIVKELLKKHEGNIEVQSVVGEGTVFTIYLRTSNCYARLLSSNREEAAQSFVVGDDVSLESDCVCEHFVIDDEKSIHELTLKPTKSTKPEMLVVEDDIEIQEYITNIFDDKYSVITADNGEMALNQLRKHNIQVIISDSMMPIMDGMEFCKQVKENKKYGHIPFIMLTAITGDEQRERGYQAGVNSFLTKPFSANLLRSRVSNLVKELALVSEEKTVNSTLEKQVKLRNNLSHIEQEFVENLNSLIEENINKTKVNVVFLTENLNMSSSTLYRRIKQITGISTNEYIRHVRLKKAEMLLLEGQHTISEVSDLVGMTTPDYFRQCFKEAFGVSPSEYVKKVLNQ